MNPVHDRGYMDLVHGPLVHVLSSLISNSLSTVHNIMTSFPLHDGLQNLVQ